MNSSVGLVEVQKKDQKAGFCSHCHQIWKLETEQGVCRWCGKLSHCQTTRTHTLRTSKSRSNGRKRQTEVQSNGYDHLQGEWLTYYQVADKYANRVRPQDKEDLLYTIMLNLAVAGKNNGHKPDNISWMYRIASFTLAQYWRDYYRRINGIDCGHCSNPQRQKCKQQDLYRKCPKAIRTESLNKPMVDEDGHITELGELIADDKALDLGEWLDIETFLLSCPHRLIVIAEKIQDEIPLNNADMIYLCRFRQKEKKRLF